MASVLSKSNFSISQFVQILLVTVMGKSEFPLHCSLIRKQILCFLDKERNMHIRACQLVGGVLAFSLSVATANSNSEKVDQKTPIKHINIYVMPYYSAALTPQGTPKVAVARAFDTRLTSNKKEDILAVRDAIQARPESITPMTLMVLAIRLYDVGLRDDAVFWFYVAKNRYFTMIDVLNMKSSTLSSAAVAITDFANLAGPFINSYAFCDFSKQEAAAQKAIEWVQKNPYQALFLEELPALAGNRSDNLKKAVLKIKEKQEKERQYLADPKNREEMVKIREKNNVPQKYCWSS